MFKLRARMGIPDIKDIISCKLFRYFSFYNAWEKE